MKKVKSILTIISTICILVSADAQTLSPKVIPTCGGYFSDPGLSVSWTIGEPIYTTLESGGIILTQGFQQPTIPLKTYYADADHDGYGANSNSQQLSEPTGIFTAIDAGDCNDSNRSVHPGNIEIIGNGIDDNCNGQVDEGCSTTQFELWGLTRDGGSSLNNSGTIMKIKTDGTGFGNPHIFNLTDGLHPGGSLMQASNGKIYGTSVDGGIYNKGVLFSYDLSASTFTKLLDFNGAENGSEPTGDLIEIEGKLFGTTHSGGRLAGQDPEGLIFSFDPVSLVFTRLWDFPHGNPFACSFTGFPGSLMLARDGKLYGTGSNVFRYDPVSSGYSNVLIFCNGAQESGLSTGSLAQADNGRIYGLCNGGPNHLGIIYSFDPSNDTSDSYRREFAFVEGSGSFTESGLMKANDGKLYGVTHSGSSIGGGVVFSFDPSTLIFTKCYEFPSGSGSYCTLMQASDGKLYGRTIDGGISNGGYVFSYDYTTGTFTSLKDFSFPDGIFPRFGKLLEVCTPNIVTNNIESPICSGTNLNVPYAAGGIFNSGNTFTAQLSDTVGSFVSPTSIGTLDTTNSGIIHAVIPEITPGGNGYRIRVVSSSPVVTGTTNANDVFINVCHLNLHLRTFIQGFYTGNGTMMAVADPVNYPNVCDTLVVLLFDSIDLENIVACDTGILSTDGWGVFNFNLNVFTPEHKYYLVVRHRNSLETWSKDPVLFNSSLINFDFTGQ